MDKKRTVQAVVAVAAVGAAVTLGALQTGGGASAGGGRSSRVQLHDVHGADVGTVSFVDRHDGVQVRVELHLDPATAATDSYHGFHVHANDDLANGEGCVADPAAAPRRGSPRSTVTGGPLGNPTRHILVTSPAST